ncbi:hypothetical protein CC79DRAFT_1354681 [Sarocladium strictum]
MAESIPPPKKKLPFKPKAIRRPPSTALPTSSNNISSTQAIDNDDDNDVLALFRRAGEMAPRLAEDLERRKKKKQERQMKKESERRRSSGGKRHHDDEDEEEPRDTAHVRDVVTSPDGDYGNAGSSFSKDHASDSVNSDPTTPPPSKRSRTTTQPSSKDKGKGRLYSSPVVLQSDEELLPPSYTSPSTRATRSQAKLHPPPSTNPIVLDDSDSDSPPTYAVTRPPARRVLPRSPSVEITDPADDDDEFNEYVLKAAAARARLQEQASASQSTSNQNTQHATTTSSPPVHAEILVTSTLPGSIPCKALVRYDQSLRLLRDSWAAKQRKAGLDVPEDSAILTWRRARVYNTSTLFHLGLRPRNDGRIAISDGSSNTRTGLSRSYSSGTQDDGLSNDHRGVLFEAWTPTTFAEMERLEASRSNPQPSSPLHTSQLAPSQEEEEEEEIKLRVLLRARGLPDIGLTVRPATTAETLVTGFRARIGASHPDALSGGVAVTLWFDGEQLGEHATLEEADIDDRDIIEVHLKAAE